MPTTFRPYTPEQSLLLPPSPRDWLPEGHLAYFLSDTVDALDLKAFYEPYEGDGRRNSPYDPRMMVKLLLFGYATGTFSSRKIAKKLHEDVAFRVLSGESFPAHRTIAEFRQRHLAAFQDLFVQVLQVAREAGLLQLGTVAIDGTKVKASASKHKAMSYGRMKQEQERLKAEIEELTSRAASTDAQEDAQYGSESSGDEIPEELKRREHRLGKIQEAIQRLRSRQEAEDRADGRKEEPSPVPEGQSRRRKREFGEPPEKKQDNFTDPESRIMKTSSGYEQCYNGQLAVESESRLIVAAKITQSGADHDELLPVLEVAQSNTGERPQAVLADAGYRSEDNFQKLEASQIDGYVALGREGKKAQVKNEEAYPATLRMQQKLQGDEGRKRYSKRKSVVEPVNGWIKSVLGFRQFSLRGLKKVSGEWTLVCLALNLRRLNPLLEWS
jgi:transposase/IS5 family transposase